MVVARQPIARHAATVMLSCLQRAVRVAAVLDAQDDEFAEVFPDAVKNPVGAPSRRPHPGKVITQRLADPGRRAASPRPSGR
jgi:hypothetical protein